MIAETLFTGLLQVIVLGAAWFFANRNHFESKEKWKETEIARAEEKLMPSPAIIHLQSYRNWYNKRWHYFQGWVHFAGALLALAYIIAWKYYAIHFQAGPRFQDLFLAVALYRTFFSGFLNYLNYGKWKRFFARGGGAMDSVPKTDFAGAAIKIGLILAAIGSYFIKLG